MLDRAEITACPAASMAQTNAGGGRIDTSNTLSMAGIVSQVISEILESERTSGVVRHYKMGWHIKDAENTPYGSLLIYLDDIQNGDFVANLRTATQTDTWVDDTGRNYGVGRLAANVSAGATTVVIDTRGAAYAQFQDGDDVVISNIDPDDIDDTSGTRERHVISGAPSWNGDQITLTLASPLANSYNATRTLNSETVYTRVAACINAGDVQSSAVVQNNTSGAGTLDAAQISVPFIGGIQQTVTLTFSDATNFTASSDVGGVTLASGAIGSNWQPNNADHSSPYVSVPSAAFGGTWANGDTVQIVTTPAVAPFRLVFDVPAGAASNSGSVNINGYGYSG